MLYEVITVKLAQVELLKSEGIEGKIQLLLLVGHGQPIDEGGPDVPTAPLDWHLGSPIDGRV